MPFEVSEENQGAFCAFLYKTDAKQYSSFVFIFKKR